MPITSFTTVVAAPGTPKRITDNPTPALPTLSGALSGSLTPRGTNINVTADPLNHGNIYLGGPALNVAAGTGWFAKLPPGQSFYVVDVSSGTVDAADIYFDTDSASANTEKIGVEVVG